MIVELVNILDACNNVHKAEEEAKNKHFFKRRKDLKEIKKIKEHLDQKINDFCMHEWNIDFIINLEQTIFAYNQILDYSEYISIPEFTTGLEIDSKVFHPIYFIDNHKGTDKEKIIILEVIGENINITIFNTITGDHLSVTSNHTIQSSQQKIENVLKGLLNDMIKNYLNDDSKL